MSGIRLTEVSKTFGSHTAVEDISLEIGPQEFVTLVGPSGCGKSTILNITAGLERPSGGRVYIGSRDVTALPSRNRNISMVFQSYALYPHMSVRQNLAFPLRVRGTSKPEIARRVRETARLMEIEALLERKPRELSGGQQQRVAIGRAVIAGASVCLLDEPLSNLDAALRVRMRAELKLLFAKMGTTIMFVTHDQAEAMTMSDRIVVLNDGRIQQQGTPTEVYRNPANVMVARFIGSPQMNILEADLDEGPALRCGPLVLPLCSDTVTRRLPRDGRLLLGLRPEAIATTPFARSACVAATARLVEHLGHSAIIHYTVGDHLTLVGMESHDSAVGIGWRGNVHIDLAAIRLFDAVSGRALS